MSSKPTHLRHRGKKFSLAAATCCFVGGVCIVGLEAAAGEAVFARIDDIKVTAADVARELSYMTEPVQVEYRRNPRLLKEFAHKLIELELLAREAKRRGFDKTESVLAMKHNALLEAVSNHIATKAAAKKIEDSEIATYYKSHVHEFKKAEFRRAHHIVVKTKAEALALIKTLKGKDLATFRKEAMKKSLDTETKIRGGRPFVFR